MITRTTNCWFSFIALSCVFSFFSFVTPSTAQDWERWLRTQPYTPPQFDRTPHMHPAPPGKVFPFHQESRSNNLKRFLRQLRREQAVASLTEEDIGPTLSEVRAIEDQLLEAALQAEINSRTQSLAIQTEPFPESTSGVVASPSDTLVASPTLSDTATAPIVAQNPLASPSIFVPAATASVKLTMPASVPIFPGSYSAPADNE